MRIFIIEEDIGMDIIYFYIFRKMTKRKPMPIKPDKESPPRDNQDYPNRLSMSKNHQLFSKTPKFSEKSSD